MKSEIAVTKFAKIIGKLSLKTGKLTNKVL